MYIWNVELKYHEFGLGLGRVFILGGGGGCCCQESLEENFGHLRLESQEVYVESC